MRRTTTAFSFCLVACACTPASAVRAASLVRRAPAVKMAIGDSKGPEFAEIIGYGFIGGQLFPPLLVGLARLGVIRLPPINTFTAIANNAIDEAVAAGEISPYQGTAYGLQLWSGFLSEYSQGGSTEFLTRAGGVCAEHAAWCAEVAIPLTGGFK